MPSLWAALVVTHFRPPGMSLLDRQAVLLTNVVCVCVCVKSLSSYPPTFSPHEPPILGKKDPCNPGLLAAPLL